MGTKWSSELYQFDFVAELPPKLVALVLSFLSPGDIRSCLLVSKRWREIILQLQPYWLSALRKLGFFQWNISPKTRYFANLKELYVVAFEHQKTARNVSLVSTMATCYPHYLAASCFVVGDRNGLVRQEKTGNAMWLRVEEIVSTGTVVSTRCINSVRLREEDLPLTWAHYTACGDLWWMNIKGICELCPKDPVSSVIPTPRLLSHQDRKGDEIMDIGYARQKEDVKVGFVERQMDSLAGERSEDEMFGGCPKCSMLLSCDIKSEGVRSHLKIKVINPTDQPEIETLTLTHQYSKEYCMDGRPNILVGSTSEILSDDNICRSHYILIQDMHPIIVFLKKDNPFKTNAHQIQFKATQKCITCSHSLPREVVHRNLKPSLSGGLLAGVYQQCLWVWKVSNDSRELQLFSKAEIGKRDTSTANYELITVGECLSIVCRFEDKVGDTIAIVQTASGQILNQLVEWIPRCTELYSHVTKWYFFLSVDAQRWLCDFASPCPQTLLTVACEGVTGRLVFFLVQTQCAGSQEDKKHGKHWVHATNYLFHQLCV